MVSGSEVALFSLSSKELEECQKAESGAKKIVRELLQYPKLLLATILILNNLINVAVVTISTYLTWQVVSEEQSQGLTIFVLTVVVTLLILFFGELLPKVYANQANLAFAQRTAIGIKYMQNVFYPLSFLLMKMSDLIERNVEKKGYTISSDDLSEAIELTTKGETTNKKQKEILSGIANFGNITAKQVMTSRLNIVGFDLNTNFADLLNAVKQSKFSRIPIYEDTIDRIKGVLYIKDLLPFLNAEDNFQWHSLIKEAFFIPQNKKIDKLLRDFQEKRVHMAVVVDEYGGTTGVVTMEDVIEEIVGEINDEFDNINEEHLFVKLSDESHIFQSKIFLHDFNKIFDIDSNYFDDVKGESESLGGLLLELFSRLPSAGDKIQHKDFRFTVAMTDAKKIKLIKVDYQQPELVTHEN